MRFTRLLLVSLGTALLALLVPLNVQAGQVTKPLTKCPRHYSRHKDDLRHTWCMDSSGRSYTPENARYVAKAGGMKTKRKITSKSDLANQPTSINN